MWAVTEPDFDAELTGAQGTGLATMAGGTVLDTWFPAPRLIPAQPADGSTRLSAAEAAAELEFEAMATVAMGIDAATSTTALLISAMRSFRLDGDT
jgi:2,3,4,5-tetrahydropyridine-2-carboxylate N-succinyltransferase